MRVYGEVPPLTGVAHNRLLRPGPQQLDAAGNFPAGPRGVAVEDAEKLARRVPSTEVAPERVRERGRRLVASRDPVPDDALERALDQPPFAFLASAKTIEVGEVVAGE